MIAESEDPIPKKNPHQGRKKEFRSIENFLQKGMHRRQPSLADRLSSQYNTVARHHSITASSPSPFPPITQSPVPIIKAENISRK
jgi:hypothetical protein